MKTTNVYLVVDQSASMKGQKAAMQQQMVWDLVKTFADEEREGHGSYNVVFYGVGHDIEQHTSRPARMLLREEVFAICDSKNQNTALWDGIGLALEQAGSSMAEADLVSIFSDGEENASRKYRSGVAGVFAVAMRREKLTVTFAGPPTAARYLAQAGVPAGNFKAWDGTVADMPNVTLSTLASTQTYTSQRRAGVTRSASFYADPSQLTAPGVRGMTKAVQPTEVKTVSRHMDGRAIADFFTKFEAGKHYYQLIKPEYIQDDKDLVVHIKDANEYRQGSRTVRMLLKLPETGKIRVRPGPHSDKFDIYVQSASVNRKLVEGQKLLTL